MSYPDEDSLRQTATSSVPNGEKTDEQYSAYDFMACMPLIGIVGRTGEVTPRFNNPADISVATNSAATNESPGFLSGISRIVGNTMEDGFNDGVSGAKKVASGVGSVVTSLFPWWFWALIGLALVAWVVSMVAPAIRRT